MDDLNAEATTPPIAKYGKLVFNADHIFRPFLQEMLSTDGYAPGNSERVIGIASEDHKILAACSFSDWNGVNVSVSFAATQPLGSWADKQTLAQLFDYVFRYANHSRLTAFVTESNKASQRLLWQTGFVCEATLTRAGHDGSDIQIWRMFRENCPWIDPEISYDGTKAKGT